MEEIKRAEYTRTVAVDVSPEDHVVVIDGRVMYVQRVINSQCRREGDDGPWADRSLSLMGTFESLDGPLVLQQGQRFHRPLPEWLLDLVARIKA